MTADDTHYHLLRLLEANPEASQRSTHEALSRISIEWPESAAG